VGRIATVSLEFESKAGPSWSMLDRDPSDRIQASIEFEEKTPSGPSLAGATA
jgi:hypothetical protein